MIFFLFLLSFQVTQYVTLLIWGDKTSWFLFQTSYIDSFSQKVSEMWYCELQLQPAPKRMSILHGISNNIWSVSLTFPISLYLGVPEDNNCSILKKHVICYAVIDYDSVKSLNGKRFYIQHIFTELYYNVVATTLSTFPIMYVAFLFFVSEHYTSNPYSLETLIINSINKPLIF